MPDAQRFIFQYSPMELCCALKPYCLLDQLNRHQMDYVVYLDSDMRFYQSIEKILSSCFRSASILLTPHLLILPDVKCATTILSSGQYNAGFLAVKNNENAKFMLNWWASCLKRDCICDPHDAKLCDQRWLDFIPVIFDQAGLFRHPGINVGHWNFHEKKFTKREDKIYVNHDDELYLFHFSGLTEDKSFKYLLDNFAPPPGWDIVTELAEKYLAELTAMKKKYIGVAPTSLAYSFGEFDDGTLITLAMREIIRCGLVDSENPFANKINICQKLPVNDDFSIFFYSRSSDSRVFKNLLKRLNSHKVIGTLWKLWRKWVNPSLKISGLD